MNIALILSGGIGKRLGASQPKQYLQIGGKRIISYVIEACTKSRTIDKIIVIAHDEWAEKLSVEAGFQGVVFCKAGKERNETLKNGLDYVKEHYSCQKIMIFDAVRPLVTEELIDEYIEKLDDYDIVLTAQRITDSLGCYDIHQVDRSRYYLLQSPEAYKFDALYKYFKKESRLTEVAQQLPRDSKTYLNFKFENNLKITYRHDLVVAEYLLNLKKVNEKFDVKRLKEYLGKNYPIQTEQWISSLMDTIGCLQYKWKFREYQVFGNSHFGLILKAESEIYGKVVVKLIPPFIGRFEGELSLYLLYKDTQIMCELYDYDRTLCALLLKRAMPGSFAEFDKDNESKVLEFFKRLNKKLKKATCKTIGHDYARILTEKRNYIELVKGHEIISAYVEEANRVYEEAFAQEEKYLLLGDVHQYNLLDDGGDYVAIDPIGYIAPKEFEAARYIGTVLTEHIDDVSYQLRNAIEKFSAIYNKRLLTAALFVDVVFRLHNTTFEDENDVLRNKWLKVLDAMKDEMKGI